MATNAKFVYSRLDVADLPQKPLILKIVLPLVLVCFVLFCLVGYFSPEISHTQRRAPNRYGYETLNRSDLAETLKFLLNCKSTDSAYSIEARGEFWVLKNFITPSPSSPVECYETVTYTTHGDYRFLDNIIPLLERWQAPLSVAVYAPGEELDYAITLLRKILFCQQKSYLVEKYASIHLYFDFDKMPDKPIQSYRDLIQKPISCKKRPLPSFEPQTTNHSYPVNVGRNIAREAALTHFVLASDIELYPNPGFVEMFLSMIAHPVYEYTLTTPSVYVLPLFEVAENLPVPQDKIELLEMLQQGNAVKFHEKICPACHTVPSYEQWLKVVKVDESLDILVTAKREGQFQLWEPIYVGTKREPAYDERLDWEGKFDKMTQGYIMCMLGYNFHVLDNAFLVHKPGIKTVSEAARPELERKQRKFVEEVIFEELKVLYGKNSDCML